MHSMIYLSMSGNHEPYIVMLKTQDYTVFVTAA